MGHRGRTAGRNHLRIAPAAEAAPTPRRGARVLLFVRAVLAGFRIVLLNVAAVAAVAVALLPIVWRRAPRGRRLRPVRREARVIPWPERRAAPR